PAPATVSVGLAAAGGSGRPALRRDRVRATGCPDLPSLTRRRRAAGRRRTRTARTRPPPAAARRPGSPAVFLLEQRLEPDAQPNQTGQQEFPAGRQERRDRAEEALLARHRDRAAGDQRGQSVLGNAVAGNVVGVALAGVVGKAVHARLELGQAGLEVVRPCDHLHAHRALPPQHARVVVDGDVARRRLGQPRRPFQRACLGVVTRRHLPAVDMQLRPAAAAALLVGGFLAFAQRGEQRIGIECFGVLDVAFVVERKVRLPVVRGRPAQDLIAGRDVLGPLDVATRLVGIEEDIPLRDLDRRALADGTGRGPALPVELDRRRAPFLCLHRTARPQHCQQPCGRKKLLHSPSPVSQSVDVRRAIPMAPGRIGSSPLAPALVTLPPPRQADRQCAGCVEPPRIRRTTATMATTSAPTAMPTTALPSEASRVPASPSGTNASSQWANAGIEWTRMPPPTRNIAAVPAMDRNFINQGALYTSARPTAARAPPCSAKCTPASSILTMPATSPYTPTVIASAMATSTSACCRKGRPSTTPSDSTMISAERMKSVRMAPLILSFSYATRSTFSSATALTSSPCFWAS